MAFLYGLIDDDVYISLPNGIYFPNIPRPPVSRKKYAKLLKSLYGLKQAPSIFRGVLHSFLLLLHFLPSDSDPCLYYRWTDTIFILLAVHVDDILIITNDQETLVDFKKKMKEKFSIKELGPLHNQEFLGSQIDYHQEDGILTVHCDRYIKESLEALGIDFSRSRPVSTPIVKLDSSSPIIPENQLPPWNLRSLSGILTYATTTCRPDIAVAASLLSATKWEAITYQDISNGQRVIDYLVTMLKEKPKLGLKFNRSLFKSSKEAFSFICYSDSDYAGDLVTCRSRSGHVIFSCNSLIYWRSRLQPTISLSSTAAEITSLSDLCRELVWITNISSQIGFPQELIPVYEDNRPAITIAYRTNLTQRTRHIRIRDLWVRELVNTNLCRIYYCSTYKNIADFFTKILNARVFKVFAEAITGYSNARHIPPQAVDESKESPVITADDAIL